MGAEVAIGTSARLLGHLDIQRLCLPAHFRFAPKADL